MTKMEGLIPLVYRAIKRKKTRRYYKCLSSGAALFDNGEFHASGHMFMTPPPENHKHIPSGTAAGFEMAEFNPHAHQFMTPPPEKLGGHLSMKAFPHESSTTDQKLIEPPRLRKGSGVMKSHRMFACIAGG